MAYQWHINVCFCLVIGLSAQGGCISAISGERTKRRLLITNKRSEVKSLADRCYSMYN